ncbi:hypothetical protein ORI20_17035 [Mycobacterium sp. CVI_P3]|uniref:Uncharacterized protein n=1 Tax=Mycobacterium pinniadriaticum TaxID=2994102 RepID=A0ABT3SGB2_9MYCO|nr:hypothetical protein [Mycobacterium pinniadriaticum]MCX2931988.1 hypothetical protein [Mycobacterium pinniadriaticum]MCX2938412.1 hypothetical protein [Mycobacterium pinniadriaticum]
MWMDLYLVVATVIAFAAWWVSPRFQAYDPPSDVARAFWAVAAGALWPLVVLGIAEVLGVRYAARRLRRPLPEELDLTARVAEPVVSSRS